MVLQRLFAFLSLTLLAGCLGTAPLSPKAVALNRAGSDALAAGNLELAEARFTLALEYHPRFVEALTNLGLVEMQRGNLERARVDLERAVRINSDLAQPHHGLGVLSERMRRPDEAADHYRDALKVDPGFSPSRNNLGRILFTAGRYDDAREEFLRLTQSSPNDAQGYAGLAECLLELGRYDDSDGVIERARARFPQDDHLGLLAARRWLRIGQVFEAEAALTRLTREAGDTSVKRAAWGWLAVARLSKGNAHGTFEAAEEALRTDPNDPLATYAVALALRTLGDPRAPGWLDRASHLSPHNPVLAGELARARAERGAEADR